MKVTTDNRIMNAVAKTDGRYAFESPRVTVTAKDRVIVSATNGHIATVRHDMGADTNGCPVGFNAILGNGLLPKPTKTPKLAEIAIEGEHCESSVSEKAGTVKHESTLKDGRFPPVSSPIPSTNRPMATVVVDIDNLARAMEAARGDGYPSDGKAYARCVTLCVPIESEDSDKIGKPANTPVMILGHGENAGASIYQPCKHEKDVSVAGRVAAARSMFVDADLTPTDSLSRND